MLTPIPAVLVTPAATNDAHKNLPTWRFRGVPFTGRMWDITVATLSPGARDGLVFDLEVEEKNEVKQVRQQTQIPPYGLKQRPQFPMPIQRWSIPTTSRK